MAADILDYSFVEVTVRSASTETPQKYYLHTGVVSIGCAASDGIRMPELTEESLLRIKISENSVFIQSSNPAEIRVNDTTLKDSNWLEVKDESKIKVSSVDVNVKIVKQVMDNLGSNRNKSTSSSPDMSSQDERAAVLDTQPYSPVYERSTGIITIDLTDDFLLPTQPYDCAGPSLQKNKAHTEDDLPSTQTFGNESLSLNKSMDNVKGMDKMDVLPPTQIFMSDEFDKSDSHLQYMKDKEHIEDDLPSTQVFINESFNLNNSMDNVKDEERLDVLPPTQIFMSDEFDKSDSHLQYIKDKEHTEEDLPSTQVFVNESFNLNNSMNNVKDVERMDILPPTQIFMCEEFDKNDNNLQCMKDSELAVEDLPCTQPVYDVPESFDSSSDNAKVEESEKSLTDEKMNSGSSQEIEFNLSNVKVEPREPSPEVEIITSHARQFDYGAHEAKVEVLDDYRDLQTKDGASIVSNQENNKSDENSGDENSGAEYREGCEKIDKKTKSCSGTEYTEGSKKLIKKSESLNTLIKDADRRKVYYKQHCCEVLRKKRAIAGKYACNPEIQKLITNAVKKSLDRKRQNVGDHRKDMNVVKKKQDFGEVGNETTIKAVQGGKSSYFRYSTSRTGRKIIRKVTAHVGHHSKDMNEFKKKQTIGEVNMGTGVKKVGDHSKCINEDKKKEASSEVNMGTRVERVQDGHSPSQNSGSETGKKIVLKVGEHVDDHSKGMNVVKKRQEVNTGISFKKVFEQLNDMNVVKKKHASGDVNMETRVSRVEVGSSSSDRILTSVTSEQGIKKAKEHVFHCKDTNVVKKKQVSGEVKVKARVNRVKDDASSDQISTTETGHQSMIKADEHVLDRCKDTNIIKKKQTSEKINMESRVERVQDDSSSDRISATEMGQQSMIKADEHEDGSNCSHQILSSEIGHENVIKADEHEVDHVKVMNVVKKKHTSGEVSMETGIRKEVGSSSDRVSASEKSEESIKKSDEHVKNDTNSDRISTSETEQQSMIKKADEQEDGSSSPHLISTSVTTQGSITKADEHVSSRWKDMNVVKKKQISGEVNVESRVKRVKNDSNSSGRISTSETGQQSMIKADEHVHNRCTDMNVVKKKQTSGEVTMETKGKQVEDGSSSSDQISTSETGQDSVIKSDKHVGDHRKDMNVVKKRPVLGELSMGARVERVGDYSKFMNVVKMKQASSEMNMGTKFKKVEDGSSSFHPISTSVTAQESIIKADENVSHCGKSMNVVKKKHASGEMNVETRVKRVKDDSSSDQISTSETRQESVVKADEHVGDHRKDMNVVKKRPVFGELSMGARVERVVDHSKCMNVVKRKQTSSEVNMGTKVKRVGDHSIDRNVVRKKEASEEMNNESRVKRVQNLQSSSGEKSASETERKCIIKAGEHDLCSLPQMDVSRPLRKVNLSRLDDMHFCDENASEKSLKSVAQVNATNKCVKRKFSSLSETDSYAELENVRKKSKCTRTLKSNSVFSYSKELPKCDGKMNSATNSSSHENTKDHCEMENVGSVAETENHTVNSSCETSKVALRYSLRPKIAKRTCQCCDSSKSHMKHQKHESQACHRSQLQTVRKRKHDSQSEKNIDTRYTLRKRAKFTMDIQNKTGCKSEKNAKSISISNDDIKKIVSRSPFICIERLSQSAIVQLCRTGFNKHQPVNIMFTGKEVPKGREIAKKLNGKVIENHRRCTHLISDEVKRTKKFLCCLASGIPIVSKDWLLQSNKAGYFLDPFPYLLEDRKGEKKFKFNLKETLHKAQKQRVFKGYSFYISKTEKISTNELKEIINAAGGKILKANPTYNMKNTYIISDKEQKAKVPALKKKLPKSSTEKVPHVTSDFVFEAVMKYNLS